MAKCYVCAGTIERERDEWNAPTCEACSASGCPVQWEDGKPTERCEGCDCLPPLSEPMAEAGLADAAL